MCHALSRFDRVRSNLQPWHEEIRVVHLASSREEAEEAEEGVVHTFVVGEVSEVEVEVFAAEEGQAAARPNRNPLLIATMTQ